MQWKIISLSLDDMENTMAKKKGKKHIKIFALELSLKKIKRKIREKSKGKLDEKFHR